MIAGVVFHKQLCPPFLPSEGAHIKSRDDRGNGHAESQNVPRITVLSESPKESRLEGCVSTYRESGAMCVVCSVVHRDPGYGNLNRTPSCLLLKL